ncbi:acyltransferase family protein [Cryobacterium soli]|uniref:acyltransferase family protein n=1 Tax=Cryobacterium soli TaxID=2220095 RepID=UPI003CCC4F73
MLRGIAIALVLVRHAAPSVFGGAGIVGVVIFFALSGYLITAILHRNILKSGRVRYARFYRNRALRLIPALVFMLMGLTVITLTINPLDDRTRLVRTLLGGFPTHRTFPLIMAAMRSDICGPSLWKNSFTSSGR